jgi:hypothetical protein
MFIRQSIIFRDEKGLVAINDSGINAEILMLAVDIEAPLLTFCSI